jgi:predicted enzyme related to lactoylglutathione lyase
MGYPVVHFEINTAAARELTRFYAEAFDWVMQDDGDDYTQINTEGVCAGPVRGGSMAASGRATLVTTS